MLASGVIIAGKSKKGEKVKGLGAEVRIQNSGFRSQKSEVRRQKAEVTKLLNSES
jgi:hypothetical protein